MFKLHVVVNIKFPRATYRTIVPSTEELSVQLDVCNQWTTQLPDKYKNNYSSSLPRLKLADGCQGFCFRGFSLTSPVLILIVVVQQFGSLLFISFIQNPFDNYYIVPALMCYLI